MTVVSQTFQSIGRTDSSMIREYRRIFHDGLFKWQGSRLFAASNIDNEATGDFNDDDGEEETILRINLSIVDPSSHSNTLEKIITYIQSFPYAAVLPVQPLTYVPSEDKSGVKVTFLRKKTKEKGSVDGGIDISAKLESNTDSGYKIEIEAKRNSEGQTVSKVFSEMLIVKALIKGISGEDVERSDVELVELVKIDSIFHKWI